MSIITPKRRHPATDTTRRVTPEPATPRRQFPGRPPRQHRWRRIVLQIGVTVILLGAVSAVALVAWVSQDLPDPNKINNRVVAQSTEIYARDGSTLLYEIHGDQRRTVVSLSNISTYIKQATISIEDKGFYKHSGISLMGTMRAVVVDVLSGSKAQGGSTLTQQLVKNSILTTDKSYIRKVKEIILSYQIEQRFSKDQILQMYFNDIPYGASNYGIEAASEAYFGKHAKDLDLAESAVMAAVVQAPTYYSPNGIHRQALLDRQHLVLSEMVKNGYISQTQADAAKAIDVLAQVSPVRDSITAPHFVFTVRDQLVQKYGEALVEGGGLRVVTTLDPALQKIAEEEVVAGAAKNVKYKASNAALVASDPKTGEVLAMVGSVDFFDTAHDGNFNVATAIRNPGSSFKPIVYLTAFTKGYSPDTLLFDLKTNFGPDGSGKDFIPNNYDLKEHGPLTMRQTLAGSLNIPAVKTLYLAGIPNVLTMASQLGYTTIDSSKVGLALAIGGGGVTLTEHVGAFAALANDGMRNPVTMVLRVEDKNGKLMEQYTPKPTRAVDANAVHELEDIMSDNSARAFVFGTKNNLTLSNRPVAAKTGTTNDDRDGWTMGFTPSLAAGVWVGNNDNSAMKAGSDGVVVAAPIWHNFMERALAGKPVEKFTKPTPNKSTKPVLLGKLSANTPISVDSETGKQIPDSCLASWPAANIKQVVVKEVHDILYYVNKDDPNGAQPTDPTTDPMYTRWEAPVQAWATKNGYVAKSPGFESCSLRAGSSVVSVSFTAPAENTTITPGSVPVSVQASSSSSITSVVYSLDNAPVSTSTSAPFSVTLDLSAATSGFHTIGATATDSTGATAAASVQINVLPGSVPTVYISSPAPKTSLAASSFPRSVTVIASDPDGVANVTLLTKNTDGTTAVLDSVNSPADKTITFSWPTTAPGQYQLLATMKSAKGHVTTSDTVTVAVAP